MLDRPADTESYAGMDEWIAEKKATFSELDRPRWEFVGSVCPELRHYVGKNTLRYQKQGSQNPIKYVNC